MASLTVSVVLKNCWECRHINHTGALTRGKIKRWCSHDSDLGIASREGYNDRIIRNPDKIPPNCPLKLGAKY